MMMCTLLAKWDWFLLFILLWNIWNPLPVSERNAETSFVLLLPMYGVLRAAFTLVPFCITVSLGALGISSSETCYVDHI